MPFTALYGDVITVTLSPRELLAIMNNGELLLPGDGLPAPSMIRIVQEGHHEAHRSDPTAMYQIGYHRDAQTIEMLGAFRAIAEELVKEFHPLRAIDLGCSAGTLTECLRNLGVAACGVDGSQAAQRVNQNVLVHDLRKKYGIPWQAGTFDLVTCTDVAEHLECEYSRVIAELAVEAAGPGGVIWFGAATPGQGGLGHVCLRSHDDWRGIIEACGATHDAECTERLRMAIQARKESDHAWWATKNSQVFRKGVLP